MCRGNFGPANGHGGLNFPNAPASVNSGRSRGPDNQQPPRVVEEELGHRPIIREEDLNRMDDMIRDVGWATHNDIDYK